MMAKSDLSTQRPRLGSIDIQYYHPLDWKNSFIEIYIIKCINDQGNSLSMKVVQWESKAPY